MGALKGIFSLCWKGGSQERAVFWGGDEIEEEKDMEGEQKDFFIDFTRRRRTRVQDFWRVFGEEGQLEAQQILLEVKCS